MLTRRTALKIEAFFPIDLVFETGPPRMPCCPRALDSSAVEATVQSAVCVSTCINCSSSLGAANERLPKKSQRAKVARRGRRGRRGRPWQSVAGAYMDDGSFQKAVLKRRLDDTRHSSGPLHHTPRQSPSADSLLVCPLQLRNPYHSQHGQYVVFV
jgi:hypothetical protein